MTAHPAQLLVLFLLGLVASAVLAAALRLLYLASARRVAVVRPARSTTAADAARASLDAERRARRRRAAMAAVALAMLLWVFAGKNLVAAFHPGGQERPALPTAASTAGR